jgi:integrase
VTTSAVGKRTKDKWPIKIRRDSVTVRIYRTKNARGYESFFVAWNEGGKRKLKSFSEIGAAKEGAESKASELARGDHGGIFLTGAALHTYKRAITNAAPLNCELDVAVKESADARAILGGRATVVEVCRDWVKRNATALPSITVSAAVEQLKEQAKVDRKSEERKKQLRIVLDRFAANFNVEVHTLTPNLISDYLAALPLAERSKRNHRDVLGFFFRWLVLRGYVPKGTDLLEGVQNYTARKIGEISIYSADEMARLIAAADDRILPFIVIAGFAGLRHAEISRLEWLDVDLQDKFIEVKAEHSKTNTRRIVPIKDNLAAWLRPMAKRSGKVVTVANISKQLLKTAEATSNAEKEIKPLIWKHNALRHTYISARVAESGDVPRVADEAGNSVAVIRSNYLKRIRPAAAKEWFEIRPSNQKNIVDLKAARASSG